MNNLMLLLKIQFQSLLLRNSRRSNKKKNAAGLGALAILAGAFMYMSVVYVSGMVLTFPDGTKHIALYVMGVMTIFMLLIFGYQSAGGHLFGFKDYDLLMSLPVTKTEVLLSKFLSFLLLEYFYGFFLLAPAMVIVGINCGYGMMYYVLGIVTWILIPLIPMVLASILSYFSMYLAGKFKYKNLMNNIFYIILMGLVFVLIFFYQTLMNKNVMELMGLLKNIDTYLPFMSFLFNGMVFNNYGQFLLGVLMNVGAFMIFIWIFSKHFMKLNGEIKSGYKVKNFKLQKSKAQSSFNALLNKEIRTYFSNTIYFMNTAVMPILMILGFGYLCFFVDDVKIFVTAFPDMVLPALAGGILFLSLMSCTTNSTISLEGKNFDTIKSFPVSTMEIFMAKITLNLLVIVPCCIICSVMALIAFNLSLMDFALCLVTTATSSFFISALGLALNLFFYRLDWESPAIIVKQSMPVLITTLGGMVVGMGTIALGVYLQQYMSPLMIVIVLNGILFILDLILYFFIKTKGIEQFNKIH